MKNITTIVWFRNDLRLEDNPALIAACKSSREVLPVYIHSDEEESPWSLGGATRWWLHQSLKSLDQDLKKQNSKLLIQKGPSFKILSNLIKSTSAKAVYWNRRYEPYIIKRDTKIKKDLTGQGIDAQSFNASLLFEPWTVKNNQGNPISHTTLRHLFT